ncbi:MAG TPA: hypothetical protein VJ486_00465 [Geothrix sp.]|nr:hypothetical protein [Geothrix sp.]
MIPQRYIIASLFIAAMLLLFAVVQAPRPVTSGGVASKDAPSMMTFSSFEPVAEFRIEDGWSPRFQGTRDPDQADPWPFEGGFGSPWEPASPYLADQGLALNGPHGRSEVVLWRGLEWRHYRFDAPLSSARLDPQKGNRLLVTLQMGPTRFETRLLEIPEGRVIWSSQSGPWSRFSWDGKAVLLGLGDVGSARIAPELLLTVLPVESEPGEATLAAWDEPSLPSAPRGIATRPENLSDDGRDLPGARVEVPWVAGDVLWFPRGDRLWQRHGSEWFAWGLEGGRWHRLDTGRGILFAHPPAAMALVEPQEDGDMVRKLGPLDRVAWSPVPADAPSWPAWDPAWVWRKEGALDAWDQRWHEDALPPERQRQALLEAFRPDWRAAMNLRVSVKGWLPKGPEVALREAQAAAWIWVGDRVLLVRLVEVERVRILRNLLR